MLGAMYGVRGIPSVTVLNGKTGQVVSSDGRADVMKHNFDLMACLRDWGVQVAPAAPAEAAFGPRGGGPTPEPVKKSGPEPLPIDDAAADAALARVLGETWEVQEGFFKTGLKVLENALTSPDEAKFRSLKRGNAALQTKLLGVAADAGTELMVLAGFEKSEELLSLPGPPTGTCSAVRDKMQAAFTKAWEREERVKRDARIKEEQEKDKARGGPIIRGGDANGRMEVGRGRRPAGGGG